MTFRPLLQVSKHPQYSEIFTVMRNNSIFFILNASSAKKKKFNFKLIILVQKHTLKMSDYIMSLYYHILFSLGDTHLTISARNTNIQNHKINTFG